MGSIVADIIMAAQERSGVANIERDSRHPTEDILHSGAGDEVG